MNEKKFNELQLEQIEKGKKDGVDVSLFSNPDYTWEHMSSIRHLLKDGIHSEKILNPNLSYEEWNAIADELYAQDIGKM